MTDCVSHREREVRDGDEQRATRLEWKEMTDCVSHRERVSQVWNI